jgi:hypothetical protein
MQSGFFELSTAICIQAASIFWWKFTQTLNVYKNTVRKTMNFTISTPVSAFVSMALFRILQFEAQISKALPTTRRARDSL